ncbi:MAG: S8 family serine peptidase, partial [Flavobacteriales bacterium]
MKARTSLSLRYLPFFFALCFFTLDKLTAQSVHEGYIDGRIFVKIEDHVPFKGEEGAHYSAENVDPKALDFLDGVRSKFQVDSVSRPFHALQGEAPNLKRTYRIRFDAIDKVDKLVRALEGRSSVDFAEKEPLKRLSYNPNDPYYTNNDLWFLPHINAPGAWDISFGTSSVTVAITDSEIDTAHDDLNGVLWQNPGETPNNGVDDDGNGYTDDYRGYDVGEGDPDPTYSGSAQKHGTHVAGLAGGHTDNSTGIASIGFGVSLMAVKISDGSGALTAGYDGITYAADQGAEVINMSWGSSTSSSTGSNAVSYAKNQGSYLVAAAGNDGTNSKQYPAAYSEVLAVGATNKSDEKASFSNYGSWVDIAAPGVDMNSTWHPNTYYNTQGTSMSSPVTAGLVGLMLSHNPSMSHSKITNCLKSTAVSIQGSYSGELGAGRIDAKAAMNCVDATVSSAPNDAGINEIFTPSGTICD